jgi:hypothetical protein
MIETALNLIEEETSYGAHLRKEIVLERNNTFLFIANENTYILPRPLHIHHIASRRKLLYSLLFIILFRRVIFPSPCEC